MLIKEPGIWFEWQTPDALNVIELAGRTCYKSEGKITKDSAKRFIALILSNGHESVLEHASMSYRVICDRGVSHEIVRHRLFSYSQESTRYCNYKGWDIEFIRPPGMDQLASIAWEQAMVQAERSYKSMILDGCKPEIARSVLPNSLKTEIVITGNFREWRHFFKMRTAKTAHPQMREIAVKILEHACKRVPLIFDEYRRG